MQHEWYYHCHKPRTAADLFNVENQPVIPPKVVDSLTISLSLTVNGSTVNIPGGNIKSVDVALNRAGFHGYIAFWIGTERKADDVLPLVNNDALMQLRLTIEPAIDRNKRIEPLTLQGIVTEKMLEEQHYHDIRNQPVLSRYYQLWFSDAASALWHQHFPCELWVNATMQQLIDKQLNPAIKVNYTHQALSVKQPMIALGLAKTDGYRLIQSGPQNNASFYDFLLQYLDSVAGHWVYEYQQQQYRILEKLPEPASAEGFLVHELQQVKVHWPSQTRYQIRLRNGIADGASTDVLTQQHAYKGLYQDILYRQPIPSALKEVKQYYNKQLTAHGEELHITCCQWPLQTYYPGCVFQIVKTGWEQKSIFAQQKYRSYQLRIMVEAVDSDQANDLDSDVTQYALTYLIKAERLQNCRQRFPDYTPVNYPMYVEGIILSEIGDKKEKTYQLHKNQQTSQYEYQVHIPLWDKKIMVLFEPEALTPHFFFPLYKGTHVLLAIDLYRATIVKVLNWGTGVKLPFDPQGNHIVFGKKNDDQTTVKYDYQQNKPVLSIKRQKAKDTELIQLEEGTLILQTAEE